MFSYKIDKDSELRMFEPFHAKELNTLITRNYAHIREWSAWLTEKKRTVASTAEWIEKNRGRFGIGKGYDVGIWHKGKIAGQIGYNYFDLANRKTEIGYWLGASFQGKGLITRSCITLIDNAFKNLNMNRVEIRCGIRNRKSRKIPEKLGFIEEGVAREAEWMHNRFIDLVIYSMLEDEWQPDIYNRH